MMVKKRIIKIFDIFIINMIKIFFSLLFLLYMYKCILKFLIWDLEYIYYYIFLYTYFVYINLYYNIIYWIWMESGKIRIISNIYIVVFFIKK